MKPIHIIGGGITGCSLAYMLKDTFDVFLYEKQPHLGGLIRTFYNLENIPYQKVSSILHTHHQWIVDLFNKSLSDGIQPVDYSVAINPLIDFQYYEFPFTMSAVNRMPWHWKESIKLDFETINGASSQYTKDLIINYYGKTVYDIFYKGYIEKLFQTSDIDTSAWVRRFLRPIKNVESYYQEPTYFPVDNGYNTLFDTLTNNVTVFLNTPKTYQDFSQDDVIVLTTRPDTFFSLDPLEYVYASFDIDSVLYSESKPDTIIYPNYVPFFSMTQFGQYFNPSKFMDKNIVVKMLLHSGDEVVYPVPLKKNQKRVQSIQSTYNNVYFAGWQANYTFLSIAESIQQASKVAGRIKHFVHN